LVVEAPSILINEVDLSSIWHVYLVECADGSLYAGIAIDVERRFREHLSGNGARYTRSHKPVRLVGSRLIGTRSAALRVERAIKRLPKGKKRAALISPNLLGAGDSESNPVADPWTI
jgi:putative endonuclease